MQQEAKAIKGKTQKDILVWKDQNKTADKFDNTIWRDKPKDIDERKETQKMLRQSQAIQTKQDVPKQWKKILPTSRWKMHVDKSTMKCQGKNAILEWNMRRERALHKGQMDK